MKDVAIIITGHDLEEITTNCLLSIRSMTDGVSYEIVLVDNGSPEPYRKADTLADRNVRVEKNLSVGVASTVGERAASASDYVLFLNNDTLAFRSDWLEKLLLALQRNKAAAAGPKQISPDAKLYATEVIFDKNHAPYHAFMGQNSNLMAVSFEKQALALNFGCILVDRKVFRAHKFDKRYKKFGHYQDIDWCLQVRQAGYGLIYTPSSEIIHIGGATCDIKKEYIKVSIEENLQKFQNKWRGADPRLFERTDDGTRTNRPQS